MDRALAMGGFLALLASGAQASSFVSVAPPPGPLGASFVVVGEPEPAQGAASARPLPPDQQTTAAVTVSGPGAPTGFRSGSAISPSLIALGEPAAPGAEPAKASARARFMPMVIRGGEVGSAVPATVAAPAPPPEQDDDDDEEEDEKASDAPPVPADFGSTDSHRGMPPGDPSLPKGAGPAPALLSPE